MSKETEIKKLLEEISHCKIAKAYFLNNERGVPCKIIIEFQGASEIKDFSVPEPWSGDVLKAKILFVSLNPGIGEGEIAPKWDWDLSEIDSLFTNKFINGIVSGKYGLYAKGVERSISSWNQIRNTTLTLFKLEHTLDNCEKVVRENYFALTDIVHCKSRESIGISETVKNECSKYLRKILSLSVAKIIICLGVKVKEYFMEQYEIEESKRTEIEGKERWVIFAPHTNARGARKIEKVLKDQKIDIETIRLWLSS